MNVVNEKQSNENQSYDNIKEARKKLGSSSISDIL